MTARFSVACLFVASATVALTLSVPQPAFAFCGFFVGKADATLFNEASQVIVVRNEDKTVISMQNDYKGDLKEFAIVVPVPQVLQRGQINVGERGIFGRIDAYSAPRLAGYHDGDPCSRQRMMEMARTGSMQAMNKPASAPARDKALGVTVEAQYRIGEYDIVILSAKESDGLETWLRQSGYRIPRGASAALKPYIRQNLKFFVAKVNLKEQAKTGFRPRPGNQGGAAPVMLTRLHVRYSPQTFPEDLMFQETKDRQNFQTRYVLHQPWKGGINACEEARSHFAQLPARYEREAQTLAGLTGWDIGDIRTNIESRAHAAAADDVVAQPVEMMPPG